MPRFHNVNGVRIQFTAEEETARDTEEQAWRDGLFGRKLKVLRQKRDVLLAVSYTHLTLPTNREV